MAQEDWQILEQPEGLARPGEGQESLKREQNQSRDATL